MSVVISDQVVEASGLSEDESMAILSYRRLLPMKFLKLQKFILRPHWCPRQKGLNITGLMGVLLEAKNRGLITKVKPIKE
jgi:hypothetical protein